MLSDEDFERKVDRISTTGLLQDYFNSWAWIHGECQIVEVEERPKDQPDPQFHKRVRRYMEYMEGRHTEYAQEILARSNTDRMREIDALADEFNQKAGRGEITPTMALDYVDRARKIIHGKGVKKPW